MTDFRSGRPTPDPARSRRAAERAALRWVLAYLGVSLVCQVALLFETLAPGRILFRTLPFAFTLAAVGLAPGRGWAHPARWPLVIAGGIVVLALFHPQTNSYLSGVAQVGLLVAVASPALWASRLVVTRRVLATVVVATYLLNAASASVGALQVFFPGQFDFALSSVVKDQGGYAEGLRITLDGGQKLYRPSGLSDVPGGAATAGVSTIVFGFGVLVAARGWPVRLVAIAGVGLGAFVIFFSQVRAAIVIAGVTYVALLALLLFARRVAAAGLVALAAPAAFLAALAGAGAVGGTAIVGRFETLVAENPADVYARNRGGFLDHTWQEALPDHPLGAGLGRYGMMHTYFGDKSDLRQQPLWAEIQWTSWVYDGGLPLVLAYAAALFAAFLATARVARVHPDPWLCGWAALIAAYDVAVAAQTFSYAPFVGQSGMEFWFLNAVVFAAARTPPDPRLSRTDSPFPRTGSTASVSPVLGRRPGFDPPRAGPA